MYISWTIPIPHTAQNFYCESYSAVIISFNYTEMTNRFQQPCAEMHFNRLNSGFLICTLLTLVIAGNFLGKRKKKKKFGDANLYLPAEQPTVSLFFPWICICFKSLRTLLGFLAIIFGLPSVQHKASGCINILLWVQLKLFTVSPKIVPAPFRLTWWKIHGDHYCISS